MGISTPWVSCLKECGFSNLGWALFIQEAFLRQLGVDVELDGILTSRLSGASHDSAGVNGAVCLRLEK